ncbi:hypothetical protein C6495_12475 [Candidatus Poribacteria bacterium]|nr:MAG: hypothetical protein C6495_12475 [Candidatus Poribacteria bacterium]
MSFFEALLLGILQGLTEFLPVSSSGHLVLAQAFLGLKEPLVFFDVMLHVGTLAAVLVVYRGAIGNLISGGVSAIARRNVSPELKFIWLILLGSIPTGVIAVLFKDTLEAAFDKVWLVSVMLIVTGGILQLPRLRREGAFPKRASGNNGGTSDAADTGMRWWHAPLIGIAQGCAITPGISRSGTTISVALLCGISAKTAAEYSFLLSIPAILGAVVLKMRDVVDTAIPIHIIAGGMLASFVVGYVALRLLLVMLNRGKFSVFSYYCVALGLASLFCYSHGVRIGWLVL